MITMSTDADGNSTHKKKWTKYFEDARKVPNDEYYTPEDALSWIEDVVQPYRTIWEPCAGAGHIVRYFEARGHAVIPTDIRMGPEYDLFKYHPQDAYDIIVTNIPFTNKRRILERMFQIGKPFVILLSTMALNSNPIRELLKTYGDWGILMPPKTINYIPGDVEGAADMTSNPKGTRSFFHSSWFCYKIPSVQGLVLV